MQTHEIYISVEYITGEIYTGQTVQFTVKFSRVNSYGMVINDYDSNDILTRAVRSQTKEAMTEKHK